MALEERWKEVIEREEEYAALISSIKKDQNHLDEMRIEILDAKQKEEEDALEENRKAKTKVHSYYLEVIISTLSGILKNLTIAINLKAKGKDISEKLKECTRDLKLLFIKKGGLSEFLPSELKPFKKSQKKIAKLIIEIGARIDELKAM